MKVEDRFKSKVIWNIDSQIKGLKGTIYEKELKMMRLKYIYKDIDSNELKKDITYLRCVKNLKGGR